MNKMIFNNPFFERMGEIGDWIILNILFVLASLPLVTAGMSYTAMYQVVLRQARGESKYVAREFIQACKTEWKQSTKIWIIFLFTGVLLAFDTFYCQNLWIGLNIAVICLDIVWCFAFVYVFPLQARIENSIKNTVVNALLLSVKYLPYTIIMVLADSIPFICIASGIYVSGIALPIYCVIGFSLTAKINSIFLDKAFKVFTDGRDHEKNTTGIL